MGSDFKFYFLPKCFDSPALDHQLVDSFWASRGRRKPISIENLIYGLKIESS